MPAWLQPVTNIVPARWFIVIARGIMLKGVGLGYLWHETLVLAGMALRAARRRDAKLPRAARLTMRTLRFLLRKEFLQIFRDRIMVAQMLLLPVIQLAAAVERGDVRGEEHARRTSSTRTAARRRAGSSTDSRRRAASGWWRRHPPPSVPTRRCCAGRPR